MGFLKIPFFSFFFFFEKKGSFWGLLDIYHDVSLLLCGFGMKSMFVYRVSYGITWK